MNVIIKKIFHNGITDPEPVSRELQISYAELRFAAAPAYLDQHGLHLYHFLKNPVQT
jgi:hypothetical protein